MTAGRKIVIIAGPNGAGMTTFAPEFLPDEAGGPVFDNADLIAAGLPLPRQLLAVARQQARPAGVAGRRRDPVSAQTVSRLADADMQAPPAALLRAARRAQEIARQTGTGIVVLRDGEVVEEREPAKDTSQRGARP